MGVRVIPFRSMAVVPVRSVSGPGAWSDSIGLAVGLPGLATSAGAAVIASTFAISFDWG